jgi:hypothetical protein
MMNSARKCAAIVVVLLFVSAVPVPEGGSPVGLLSKVILEVSRKETGKSWDKAVRGQTLNTGDMIRTGKKSLAIVKFKDNSLVRIREESELTVTGTTKGSSFSKTVDVQGGVVGFNVQKQKAGEEFRFTSPTSVASIRGTSGAYLSSDTLSQFTLVDGTGQLRNTISNRSVDVQGGYTGICRRDGSIVVRPSSTEDRRMANDALQDDLRKRLEIELQDPQGKSSKLRIDIKE